MNVYVTLYTSARILVLTLVCLYFRKVFTLQFVWILAQQPNSISYCITSFTSDTYFVSSPYYFWYSNQSCKYNSKRTIRLLQTKVYLSSH